MKSNYSLSFANLILAIFGTYMVWKVTGHNGHAVFWTIIAALHFS